MSVSPTDTGVGFDSAAKLGKRLLDDDEALVVFDFLDKLFRHSQLSYLEMTPTVITRRA
jgi:hypothetical protein